MTVYVFTGPTVTPSQGRARFDGTYLPPAQQGDVYRAARRRPQAIAIIDGYFERVPAVWHKEILYAISEGIPVLGCSSMGALRAAELAPFGMIGIGAIFEAFTSGDLEDDDEVAIVHASADDDYRQMSEAMVNMRFTLRRAVDEGTIGETLAKRLVSLAKSRFYAERSWRCLLADASSAGVGGAELVAFGRWLPTGRVDQKRKDAEDLLDLLDGGIPDAPDVNYRVEHTIWWDHLTRDAGSTSLTDSPGGAVALGAILDELRLDGDAYTKAFNGALLRHAAISSARRAGASPSNGDVQATIAQLCRRHGIENEEQFAHWRADNDLENDDLFALARDEALLERGHRLLEVGAIDVMADHLRTVGQWASLVERARRKQAALTATGRENPCLDDTGLDLLELCRTHAGRIDAPAPVTEADVGAFATSLGFASAGDLSRALIREHLFLAAVDR